MTTFEDEDRYCTEHPCIGCAKIFNRPLECGPLEFLVPGVSCAKYLKYGAGVELAL